MADCCEFYQEGMDKLNAPIILATLRAGKQTYDGKPFNYCPWCGAAKTQQALTQNTDPDLSKCPNCHGEADIGHDRCLPPNPYLCTKCAEEIND